jgi:hypothetical protein
MSPSFCGISIGRTTTYRCGIGVLCLLLNLVLDTPGKMRAPQSGPARPSGRQTATSFHPSRPCRLGGFNLPSLTAIVIQFFVTPAWFATQAFQLETGSWPETSSASAF